jgi:hypothetical protein
MRVNGKRKTDGKVGTLRAASANGWLSVLLRFVEVFGRSMLRPYC